MKIMENELKKKKKNFLNAFLLLKKHVAKISNSNEKKNALSIKTFSLLLISKLSKSIKRPERPVYCPKTAAIPRTKAINSETH